MNVKDNVDNENKLITHLKKYFRINNLSAKKSNKSDFAAINRERSEPIIYFDFKIVYII